MEQAWPCPECEATILSKHEACEQCGYKLSVRARAYLARAYEADDQGQLESALAACNEALQLAPLWGEAHHLQGNLLADLGRQNEAIAAYRKALDLDPADIAVQEDLEAAQNQPWESAVAAEGLRQALRAEQNLGLGFLAGLVVVSLLVGAWGAQIIWQRFYGDYFGAVAHNEQAFALSQQGDRAGMVAEYQKAIQLYPNWATPHNNLAWVYYYEGEWFKASQAFQEAIRLNPSLAAAHEGLGWVYFEQASFEQAVEAFQTARKLDPTLAGPALGLGWVYLDQSDFGQAVDYFTQASQAAPDWSAPEGFLAFIYYERVGTDLMEEALQRALARPNQDGFSYYILARLYFQLNQYPKAEHYSQLAVEWTPRTSAYQLMASIYSVQGKFTEALAASDKIREREGESASFYTTLGRIYLDQQQFEKAEKALRQALELDPDEANIQADLSLSYRQQGQMAEAVQAAEAAIRLDPRNPAGYQNLAFAQYDLGQFEPALAAALQAIRLQPEGDINHYILGLCYLKQGQPELAKAEFETFLKLYQDHSFSRNLKAEAEAYLAQLS